MIISLCMLGTMKTIISFIPYDIEIGLVVIEVQKQAIVMPSME